MDRELALLRRAAQQGGLVTRADAMKLVGPNVVHNRLKQQQWVRVFPTVYRIEASPVTWHQSLQAVSLWLGRQFVFSHVTAAVLLGLMEGERSVVITTDFRVRSQAGLEMYRRALQQPDVTRVGRFPVTNVARTLIDLAASMSPRELRAVVDRAVTKQKTTQELMENALMRAGRAKGTQHLHAILAEYRGGDGPSESELETRVFRLIESANLPRPVRQHVELVDGKCRRLDLLFPELKVVIEADGYATHANIEAFERDRVRNNSLTARGFVVLHWTWKAIRERPGVLLSQLAKVLNQRRVSEQP